MSNEIKEILFNLEIVARKHTIEVCEDGSKIETMPASVIDELRLNNFSAKILLDYITNLQQEKEDYKFRVEKAIEYINKHKIEYIDKHFEDDNVMVEFNEYTNPQALLELLQEGKK